MTVHVCGAVQKQGVYKLPQGSRVCDAVDAAGGFAPDADTSWLNLAAVVEDASQIRIPTEEETQALRENPDLTGTGSPYLPESGQKLPGGISTSGEDDRIDLNTASLEQLMTLPGIGEAKAGQIITYREKNGRFETIEDIMKVPGIKNAGFEKLKEYITVR
ncbi:MAG: ComEA family DNA-binding protein [Sarcina sp.]|nr:ComEA family DNA-binding protein [Sarcina sp.]